MGEEEEQEEENEQEKHQTTMFTRITRYWGAGGVRSSQLLPRCLVPWSVLIGQSRSRRGYSSLSHLTTVFTSITSQRGAGAGAGATWGARVWCNTSPVSPLVMFLSVFVTTVRRWCCAVSFLGCVFVDAFASDGDSGVSRWDTLDQILFVRQLKSTCVTALVQLAVQHHWK